MTYEEILNKIALLTTKQEDLIGRVNKISAFCSYGNNVVLERISKIEKTIEIIKKEKNNKATFTTPVLNNNNNKEDEKHDELNKITEHKNEDTEEEVSPEKKNEKKEHSENLDILVDDFKS